MRAEIDMYSGRPNPAWDLTASQAAELKQRLANAPPQQGSVLDNLGYRGITVMLSDNEFVTVSNGIIQRHGPGGQTATFADPGRALERWLFESSKGRVPEEERQLAAAELAN